MEDQRVIELLAEISKDLKKIAGLMEGLRPDDKEDPKNWWPRQKTLDYLGVSIRTLYTLRVTKEVTASRKGSQYRYFVPDLLKIRDFHLK